MVKHVATVIWNGENADLPGRRYSRAHRWEFDGGIHVPASSSPHVVPLPWSDEQAIDPEEALVAAAASCHMMSFLYVAAREGYGIAHYRDAAEGELAKNADGRFAIVRIVLRPEVAFVGKTPDAQTLAELHHQAHEECFIANSLKTEIVVAPPNAAD